MYWAICGLKEQFLKVLLSLLRYLSPRSAPGLFSLVYHKTSFIASRFERKQANRALLVIVGTVLTILHVWRCDSCLAAIISF